MQTLIKVQDMSNHQNMNPGECNYKQVITRLGTNNEWLNVVCAADLISCHQSDECTLPVALDGNAFPNPT